MSETYEHYCAPGNENRTCHECGELVNPGEIVIDLPERGEMVIAHEGCVLQAIEDMQDEAA